MKKSTIGPFLLVASWFLWLRHRDELFFPFSVNDKSKILSPVAVPDYIPELTVGGLDADSIFHSYREVRGPAWPFRVNTECPSVKKAFRDRPSVPFAAHFSCGESAAIQVLLFGGH